MKAMVLCAGFGTRLGNLTRELPKSMLPVNGHPMLAYILANLARQSFTEIVINLHFRPDDIREHFGDGSRWGLSLTYSEETTLLGTAGAVKKLAAHFRDDAAFLVHYGDVITDQDFRPMLDFHREHKALATLLLHQRAKSNSVVSLDPDQRVTGFLERPTEEARRGVTSAWVNSGVCLCSPEVLDLIPDATPCDLPRDVFVKLTASGRLWGFPLTGYRCAVDSPERLQAASETLSEGRCGLKPLT